MNKLSLFSGAGMDDLASHWAGITTVCMCEKDEWCRKLLSKRFPGIPIIEDVHNVTKETVYEAIANSSKLRCNTRWTEQPLSRLGEFSETLSFRINLIAGGVPCQPASVAGKRLGKADDRWLWDEAIRIVAEFKPTWVLFENPVGINSLDEFGGTAKMGSEALNEVPDMYSGALDGICTDLEKEGYEVQTYNVPACSVGAFHRRYRIFIVGYSIRSGLSGESRRRSVQEPQNGHLQSETYVAHCNDKRKQQPSGGIGDIGGRLDNGNQEGLASHANDASTARQREHSGRGLPKSESDGFNQICPNICYPTDSGLPDWAGGKWGMPSPLTEFIANTESNRNRCQSDKQGNTRSKQDCLRRERMGKQLGNTYKTGSNGEVWEVERVFCGVATRRTVGMDGFRPMKDRVNRLKALGNGCVPEQVYPFYKAMVEIDDISR